MSVLDEKMNEAFLAALENGHATDEDIAVAYGLSIEAAREAMEAAVMEYTERMPEDTNVERAIAEVLRLIKPDATVRDFLFLKAFLIDMVGSVGCRSADRGVLIPTPDQPVVVIHITGPDGSTSKLAIQMPVARLLEMAEIAGMLSKLYKNLSQLPPTGALLALGVVGDEDEAGGEDDGEGYSGQDD